MASRLHVLLLSFLVFVLLSATIFADSEKGFVQRVRVPPRDL